MQMTRACMGNLINKYKAVLQKCRVLEMAGALALGVMLTLTTVPALAADLEVKAGEVLDVTDVRVVDKLTVNGILEVQGGGKVTAKEYAVGSQGSLRLDAGHLELGSDGGWLDALVRIHVDGEEDSGKMAGKVVIADGGKLALGTLTLDRPTATTNGSLRLGSEAGGNTALDVTLNKLTVSRPTESGNAIYINDDTATGPTINFRAQAMPSKSSEYVFMDQDMVITKGKVVLGVGNADTQGIHKSRAEDNTIVLGADNKSKATLEVAKGEWRIGDIGVGKGNVIIKQGATLGLHKAQNTIDSLETPASGADVTITVGEGNAVPMGVSTRLRLLEDTTIKVGTLSGTADAANKIVILSDGMLKMGDDKKLTLDVSGGDTMSVGGTVKTFNLDVKNGNAYGDLTVQNGMLVVFGNLQNAQGGINAGKITVNDKMVLGDADEGMGGTVNANLATTASGNITVKGSAWTLAQGKEVSIDAGGVLALVHNGSLDVSKGSLKVASGGQGFVQIGTGTSLHITAGDVTYDGNGSLTGNIKNQLQNFGTLKVTGTNLADAAAFQKFRSALTSSASNGMISLVSQDPNAWVTSSTTLSDVSSTMSGLDLTKSKVKASGANETINNNVFVGQIDASTVNGAYTIAGSGIVTVAGVGAGEQLIKTKNANDKVTANNLQLGMGGATSGTQQNLEVKTKLDVVGGSYTVGTLKTADTTLHSGANLHVGSMDASGSIIVGNGAGAGTLTADSLKLGGNLLFADPAWITGGVHNGTFGSRVAVKDLQGTAKNVVDGDVYAGQASQISLRTTDTSILSGILQKSKLWGTDITAALYLHGPVKLDGTSGALHVNGAQTTKPAAVGNVAVFADKSLLVVNAVGLGTAAAITGDVATSTATVDAGSRLHLTNAVSGTEYTILDDFKSIAYAEGGFSGVGNLLQTVEVLDADAIAHTLKVKVESQAAASVFTNLDSGLGNMLNEMNLHGLFDTESSHMGYRFLSRAVDGRLSVSDAEKTIEGAARMGVAGGAQQAAVAAAQAGVAAADARLSMTLPTPGQNKAVALHMDADSVSADTGLNAGDGLKNGVGLWIMPLYQSMNSWGMKAGNFKTGVNGDMGGVALGADYTFNEALRAGVTFNIGGGYAKSSGDFNQTDNNFNFWGVGLYGGWMQNNFGLSADVNYTSTYNKMQQDLPYSMGMSNLKSDVQTQAVSAGLRAEYKWETSALDITPHIGVRYLNLATDSYSIESAGQKVFKGDAIQQNIWTFPVGVTLGKTLESQSGWNFTPRVDLAVVPAAGDMEAKGTVKVPGLASSADMSTQIMDYITYQGGVGFDLGKDGFSMGLNYTIQAGEHSTAHGLNATFRYEF